VGSKNPVKINSARQAVVASFPGRVVECVAYDVPSGVADQPWGDVETRQGALARAQACHAAHEAASGCAPDLAIGLEGGCVEEDLGGIHRWPPNAINGLGKVTSCFAFLAVLKAGSALATPRWGVARTASFPLPPRIVDLMRGSAPMELGDADDAVFKDTNSKQKGGTIGKCTHGLIDRTAYYEHALICALVPFVHDGLYG
jgi:non-canonical (house-cleaning) NTP pyrophosphatase